MGNLIKTNEPVEALAIFTKKGPKPYALKWGKKNILLRKSTWFMKKKQGMAS